MYIVRFVRADGKPDEEYFYHREEDARYHVSLSKEDNSGLYTKVELLENSDKMLDVTCIFSIHDVK